MLGRLLDIIAPHYCCGCGKIGAILCSYCKYDIVDEIVGICPQCRAAIVGHACTRCSLPYQRAYMVGERRGTLEALIDASKYQSVREGCAAQAELLEAVVPRMGTMVVVPLPTIAPHIRQRGYGHTELIAKSLAFHLDAPYRPLIFRLTADVQRGSTKAQRRIHAKRTFAVEAGLDPSLTYLLVDDVTTTGVSLEYAVRALRDAGARRVWVAVTAYQSLDEK